MAALTNEIHGQKLSANFWAQALRNWQFLIPLMGYSLSGEPELPCRKFSYLEVTLLKSPSQAWPSSHLQIGRCVSEASCTSRPAHLPAEYNQWPVSTPHGTEELPSWALPKFLTHETVRYHRCCVKPLSFSFFYTAIDDLISSHSVLFLEDLISLSASVTIYVLRIRVCLLCPALSPVFQTSVISTWSISSPVSFLKSLLHLLYFLSEQMRSSFRPVAQKMKSECHPPFLLPHPQQLQSPVTPSLLTFQISCLPTIPAAKTLVYPTNVFCPDD